MYLRANLNIMDEKTLILKTQIELSTHRVKVLKAFASADVLRPKEIVLAGMNPNNVSRTLGQLKKMDLVTVVNSKCKARYYGLTNRGKNIWGHVDN